MTEPTPRRYSLDKLQKTALTLMSLLVLVTFLGTNLQAVLWQSSDWLVSTVLPATVVDLTNDEREDANQAPLVRNATLDEAARLKAQHMAKNEYFSHYSPDGVSPWHWFGEVDYVYAHAGENLAIHFTDSSEVVEAWMDSPTHRDNIVSSKYTEIGVGTAKGEFDGYDTVYVVQLFGTPGVTYVEPTPTPTPTLVPVPTPEPVAIPVPEPIPTPEPTSVSEVEIEPVPVEETTAPAPIDGPLVAPESIDVQTPVPEPAPVPDPVNEIVIVESENPAPVTETVTIANDVVVVETPLIATSSGLAVANLTEPAEAHAGATVASVATQPSTVMQIIYLSLGVLILLLLVVSIVLEARQLRYIQVAYSFFLLIGMGGLWFINALLTEGAVIL